MGELKEPNGKEGDFSQENWGNYKAKGPGGEKTIERATIFKKRIDKLPVQHWEAIMAKAEEFVVKKKRVAEEVLQTVVDSEPSAEDVEAYENALFDPMFA
jgi:hypothetical protein